MRSSHLAISTLLLAKLVAAAPAQEAVAVISSLSGKVTAVFPGLPRREARLFDWLPAGTVVETGPETTAILAFVSGSRYELGPGVKATLSPGGPTEATGALHALPAVPPLPRIGPVQGEGLGRRAAAVRIRGERVRSLYPSGDAVVLADHALLSFAPVPLATAYRVDVEDEDGRSVLHLEVRSSEVSVPPATLLPGRRYLWYVRATGGGGPAARAEAEFRTLDADKAAAREAVRVSPVATGDKDALVLLAEVDHALGLLREARDGVAAALARSPGDAGLQAALARLDTQLTADEERE